MGSALWPADWVSLPQLRSLVGFSNPKKNDRAWTQQENCDYEWLLGNKLCRLLWSCPKKCEIQYSIHRPRSDCMYHWHMSALENLFEYEMSQSMQRAVLSGGCECLNFSHAAFSASLCLLFLPRICCIIAIDSQSREVIETPASHSSLRDSKAWGMNVFYQKPFIFCTCSNNWKAKLSPFDSTFTLDKSVINNSVLKWDSIHYRDQGFSS